MKNQNRNTNRRGIATVECALCLPLIVVLTFGVIETCSALFLKETLTIAAYEGARVGIQSGGTESAAESRILEILDQRGISYTDNSVSFSSPSFSTAAALDAVTTTVSVSCDGNTIAGWFFNGRTVSASTTMRKEYQNP